MSEQRRAQAIDAAMLVLEQRIRDQPGSADMIFEWIAHRFANISERHASAATSLNRRPHKPEWRKNRFAEVYAEQRTRERNIEHDR